MRELIRLFIFEELDSSTRSNNVKVLAQVMNLNFFRDGEIDYFKIEQTLSKEVPI